MASQCGNQVARPRPSRSLQVDKHDVGLRRLHHQPRQAAQAGRQPLRQRMVVGQALHLVSQGMGGGCRQAARLTHAAARHLADPVCPGNQFAAAAQGRADWRTQPLAEAD